MAYTTGEYRIQVRGTVGATESWNNTWCVIDPTGVQDINEAGAILNAFYEDICGFAAHLGTGYTAIGATARHLTTGLTTELTWSAQVGASSNALLPTQIGLRISLKSGLANGGPFICGFVESANTTGGIPEVGVISDFVDALETMTGSLTAAGWQLGLDQPTAQLATQVTQGRIGRRWDVIRKRANDTAEAYTTFDVA